MLTVPEATEIIVKRSRYLSEAMTKGIINNSSLARYIKPEIEEMLIKKVNDSSVIMALNRLQKNLKPQSIYSNIFKNPPTMIIRSNLIELNISNLRDASDKYNKILALNSQQKYFLTFSRGISETTIIFSNEIYGDTLKVLKKDSIISEFRNLSSITIQLPQNAVNTPGIFYFFLKSLAWEGVNIIETVSTFSEFTIVFEDKDVNKAFAILKSLFA